MKFWCVSNKYFDSGRVKATVFQVEADTKPKNEMTENKMCDSFDTYEEAAKFAKQAMEA